eukprot:1195574-Prorocentrum_minimum.AAC.3
MHLLLMSGLDRGTQHRTRQARRNVSIDARLFFGRFLGQIVLRYPDLKDPVGARRSGSLLVSSDVEVALRTDECWGGLQLSRSSGTRKCSGTKA